VKWQNRMGRHWHTIRFGSLKVQCSNQKHEFVAEVYLNQVLSDSVSVELYAEPHRSGAAVRIPMARGAKMTGSVDGFVYTERAPPSRPAPDYTVRVVPSKSGVLVPREVNSIVWQKT
jgi:hypothetical protein